MNQDVLIRKLNSVGKAIFVEYFITFQSYSCGKISKEKCIDLLVQDKVSNDNGAAIRCGNAKQIFDAEKEYDALLIVTKSEQISGSVIAKARKLIDSKSTNSPGNIPYEKDNYMDEDEYDASKLMPYLRTNFDEQSIRESLKKSDAVFTPLIRRPFSQELNLSIYLANDRDGCMEIIDTYKLSKYGLTEEEAFGKAYNNLVNSTNPENFVYVVDGIPMISYFSGPDGYDATRILLPNLISYACGKLGVETCYIVIPNRDYFMAFHPAMLSAQMQQQVRQDFRSKDHPVTDRIFAGNTKGQLHILQP
jgi:hypothetical protein